MMEIIDSKCDGTVGIFKLSMYFQRFYYRIKR